MSCFTGRNGNISRVKPLQRAHFKNLYEMKRFVDEQKMLAKDHRRSMFLINKEIQEVQKTLWDIKLISGYCHQDFTAHLRSVSIAFSTFKEYKKARKLGSIDLNVESTDSVMSEVMFGQRHDRLKHCLSDAATGDCESDLSQVDQHSQTLDTEACKKQSSDGTHLMRSKNCNSLDFKNGLGQNRNDDYFEGSSHFGVLELSSNECNGKGERDGLADAQKTSQASPKRSSCNTKTDLKNSSFSPTGFTLHRRAASVYQKLDLYKRPTAVVMKPSSEQDGLWPNQSGKMLSRYFQDKKNNARSHISKAAIKRGLDLLIKEYNCPPNVDLLNNRKQSVLQDNVSNFVSELSEIKCKV